MKYLRLIIWAAIVVVAQHALPRPLYIYSSVYGIISLDTDDVVSIDYVPADGDAPAMQRFMTENQVYSIPIEEIDYVGFETPENVHVPGTDRTAELSPYVVRAEQLTLYVDDDAPEDVVPIVNQTIFVEADGERLTLPFAGRVSSVAREADVIAVTCDPVELTDIFETYYGVIEGDGMAENGRRRAPGKNPGTGFATYRPAPFKSEIAKGILGYERDDDSPFSISGEAGWFKTISPEFKYKGYLVVSPEYGVNLGVTVITDLTVSDEIRLAGSVNLGQDLKLFGVARPIPQALIDLYFEVGLTGSAAASVAYDKTVSDSYRHTFSFDWSSKGREKLNTVCDLRKTDERSEGVVAVNGSLSCGVYVEIGVAFICSSSLDIAKADVRFEAGLKTEGNWVPSKSEAENALFSPNYYNKVAQSYVDAGFYTSGAAELHLFGWSPSYDGTLFDFANNFLPWEKISFVPEFNDMRVERVGLTSAEANVGASGTTLPCDLGMAIIDKRGRTIQKVYSRYDNTGPASMLVGSFSGLDAAKDYEIRPLVKAMGVEMVADPAQKLEEIPIFGSYRCVWNTTPPNAKLLTMVLREDYTMSQTYYYANRDENVTYNCTFSRDGDTLTMYKDNGDTQNWHIDELTDYTLVISQPDGFAYHLVK